MKDHLIIGTRDICTGTPRIIVADVYRWVETRLPDHPSFYSVLDWRKYPIATAAAMLRLAVDDGEAAEYSPLFAREVVEDLHAAGFTVWVDQIAAWLVCRCGVVKETDGR